MAAAIGRFELGATQADGATLEQHLLKAWAQTGIPHEMLDIETMPFELTHVWDWWHELDQTRQTGFNLGHITFVEIASWSKLLNLRVSAFEVRCLMAIDNCHLQWRKKFEPVTSPANPSS